MATCSRIQKKRQKLCTGDLDEYVDVQLRTLIPAGYGQFEPDIVFTAIGRWPCLIQTFSGRGTEYFHGVNIGEGVTHAFIFRRFTESENLEVGNNFILYDDRRFRILGRTIMQEDKYAVMYQCTERGDDDEGGADA